tara:strand:+ start:393 stop:1067 length:675 start_codon:yes stop_codon:yes gene_type:complete
MEIPREIWDIIVTNAETVYTKIDESTEFNKIYDYVIHKAIGNFDDLVTGYNKKFNVDDIVKYIDIHNNTKYFIWRQIPEVSNFFFSFSNEDAKLCIRLVRVFPTVNASFLGHVNIGNYQQYGYESEQIYVLEYKLLLHESRTSIVDKINNYQFNKGNIVLYKTGYRSDDKGTILKVCKTTIRLDNNKLINKKNVFMIYNNNETTIELARTYYSENSRRDLWAFR